MSLLGRIGSIFKTQGKARIEDSHDRVSEILKALGGAENIAEADSCFTSLRVTLRDITRINEDALSDQGASAVLKTSNKLQIVMGAESDYLREEIEKHMLETKGAMVKPKIMLLAPLTGKLLPLSQVPDQAFSQKIMGDGFAIDPSEGKVISPVDATVVQIFRTGHAIGLETDSGVEILIHVGIDTVKLNGKGFTALVQNGQRVKAGQELIHFDLEMIKSAAPSVITPIVFTNMERVASIEAKSKGDAKAGEEIASLELQV